MPDITDHENYRYLESLLQSSEGRGQRAQYPDSPLQTVVGISEAPKNAEGEETEVPEGFLAARKTNYWDKAPEGVRGAAKMLRAVGPSASVAGLAGLAGGIGSGGLFSVPAAIAALGAKGIYDAGSGLVVNPLSRIFTGNDLLPSSNALSDRIMDKLRIPYPESRTEEVMTNLTRAGIDAFGGGPALGKIIADAAPVGTVTKGVGTVMQEAPAMQALGGMSGQGVVEAIDPEGRSPTLDTFAALAGGMLPFLARGIPQALYGKRAMTPEYQDAMRRALDARSLEVSNSNIEMSPRQVEGFIRDAESSNSLSAGIRGLTQGRGFFEPMQNRLAVKNVEQSILQNVLNPSDVVENINRVQAGNIEGEIPGLRLRSDSAGNDAGVTAALAPANSNPRSIQRGNTNQAALSGYATDIAAPNATTPGAFNEAASQRQSQFLNQPMREAADAGIQVAEQQRLLQEIQNARALAEQELKDLQMRLANQGSSLERGAASEATAAEYWKKYEALQKQMEASKLPSELSKPISTAPLVEGIQESKGMSATALERPNPLVSETEQQLRRFGVEPTATGEAPAMSKTVIASEPRPTGKIEKITPERAAEIEAMIKAAPAPAGKSSYIQDLAGPTEFEIGTKSGKAIKVRRKLVELDDVIRNGKSQFHPEEYQNRDRSTGALQNQVNEMVGNFNPRKITGSNEVGGVGAPMVGPEKNVLESGHGRMAALERIFTEPSLSAQKEAYLAKLKENGHDVTGFKNPVEVQERVTAMTPQEVQATVADLNASPFASLSTKDIVASDVGALTGQMLDRLDPSKPLYHPANSDFITSMNREQLGGDYSPWLKADNTPNSSLTKRYQDALSQVAYGGESRSAEVLLRELRDSADAETLVKTIGAAMEDAAGNFAKLKSKVKSGEIPKEYDLGEKIAEAAAFVRHARNENQHPLQALKTADMFGGPDQRTRSLVELFYNESSERQVGTKALGKTLNQMAEEIMQQKGDLLGADTSKMTPDQLIQRAKQRLAKTPAPGSEPSVGALAAEAAPESTAMAKATTAAEEPPLAMKKDGSAAPPDETASVSAAAAPPEQFRVQNALELLDSYKAKMRAAERVGGPEWANAKEKLQPIISRIEAQIEAETTAIQAGKETYAKASPDLIHGLPSQLRKAGAAGDPQNIHQSRTLDLWFNKNGASSTEAKQLAKIMGDTPDNVDAVRQYVMSRVAAETGEAVTGEQIRSWKKTHDQILSQPEFSPIGEELRKYANKLDSQSTAFDQAGKDIAAERLRLQELESSRTAAESNLERQRGISEEAGGMRVASGKSDKINQVLSDPSLARDAVATANTPAARADLDNQIRAVVDRRLKNNGVNTDRPVGTAAPTVDELNVSMAKTVRTLLEGEGRQALETLTSPAHVRRLDMLANALEAESKPSKMLRGSITGSPTQQYSAVDRAAQASSSNYRRIMQTTLQVLNDTNTYRQFLTDVQLNPELLKQITLMHQAKDPSRITGMLRAWAKTQGRMTGVAGQLDRGWRKREQDDEESGEAPSAPDEKE
jgi:hypothetical protein